MNGLHGDAFDFFGRGEVWKALREVDGPVF
jgi:hypothetical protein